MQISVTFNTPETSEQLSRVLEDFLFLFHFAPAGSIPDDPAQMLSDSLGLNTLVYVNSIPIGCFRMSVFKRTVELHGICRPDINQCVPKSSYVKLAIQRGILTEVFGPMDKDKVIIKADPSNKGARGFAMIWGFKRLPNVDKGRLIWKLTKEDFIKRVCANGW